ncbi:protein of unknown function DUF4782 containing protein [Nitzschia inconspicua]|uniref:VASt domain-containing protein n=1 Tax=Nitzschia inconspicua TaxID=303405 RepID=A0A9K3LP25_9STRA|nr:protein of unknown function DUF4782 containing protein [Nitzschia inconspicua]
MTFVTAATGTVVPQGPDAKGLVRPVGSSTSQAGSHKTETVTNLQGDNSSIPTITNNSDSILPTPSPVDNCRNTNSATTASSKDKDMRRTISADDLLLLQHVTSTTKEGDDDDGSVISVASEWVMSTFFPSTATNARTTTRKRPSEQRITNLMDCDADLNIFDKFGGGTEDDDNSTTSSVHTIRYFEPSDFKMENWENLSAAQIGFAVMAGGFMCFHPVMFVAGVLTAFGTLQAAGATYDYCENSSSLWFCGRNDTTSTTTTSAATNDDKVVQAPDDDKVLSDAGQAPTATEVAEEKKDEFASIDDGVQDYTDPMRQLSQLTFSQDSGSVLPQGLVQNIVQLNNDPTKGTGVSSSPDSKDERINSSLSALSQLESQEAVKWIDAFYPSLSTNALDRVEFHGLNAREFFNVFFSDSAPFGFEAFHKIRKDKNVRYGKWETLEGVIKPCLLSQAPTIAHDPRDGNDTPLERLPIQERLIEFEAKTNSFLGPPYAKTTKVQRALQLSKRVLVLEMKTTLSDIPFSNRFYVMERWLVTSESHPEGECLQTSPSEKKNNTNKKRQDVHNNKTPMGESNSSHHPTKSGKMTSTAFLTITSQVVFTQACAFEATILKESAKQISEISNQWNKMAQAGLKRTEETRRQRLMEEELEDEDHLGSIQPVTVATTKAKDPTPSQVPKSTEDYENDGSIEIQHMGRRNSWVAGDPYCPPLNDEYHGKDLSLNARLSMRNPRRLKKGRRSITQSLSNLIPRRRSSTLSTSTNETLASPSKSEAKHGAHVALPLQVSVP